MADAGPRPFVEWRLTDHARIEMQRRGISEDAVQRVLAGPEQIIGVRPGRVVAQSREETISGQPRYLVRVFVDVGHSPAEVVTVYRTSQIRKYWRTEP